jgi:hypothetical protein
MKLIILRLGAANKKSPMSEGVTEIRINNQPCKGINLTTRHVQARRAPRVETIHDEVKEMVRAHLTLVHILHVYASADTPCVSTFKCLFIQTQPMRALTDTGGGYHLGAPNIRSDHSPSFPSSILHFPLIAPSGLQLCQPFDYFAKPCRTSIDRNGPIASRFQPLVFYR